MKRLTDENGLLNQDLVGFTSGRLTIVSRKTERSKRNYAIRVEVRCANCQATHMADLQKMRLRPNTKACPHCNPRQNSRKAPEWIYARCQQMKNRCTNRSAYRSDRYVGRGIEFRFKTAAEAADWILENLGMPSSRRMQLDRIDNEGHYEPGNLRWADPITNINNTSAKGRHRERFKAFRSNHPEIRYADNTLHLYMTMGMTDEQIIDRFFNAKSSKPKGKYGTFSKLGPYKDFPPTD